MNDSTKNISSCSDLLSSLSSLLSGSDRITRTVSDVLHDSALNADVRRTRSYVWTNNGADLSLLTSTALTSVDGLRSWQISFGLTNESITVFGSSGYRYTTNFAPDRSYSVSISRYGTNVSSTHFDSSFSSLSSVNYSYDPHGRMNASVDARNGGTTNWFNAMDQISSTKTPIPATGQSAQVTTNFFDSTGRIIATKLPDNTYLTNSFTLKGETYRTYGSRTYATGNKFDVQGRQTALTNWSTFPSSGARVTTWNFNQYRGWLDNKRYPDNTGPNYGYTAAGRMNSRTWARGTNASYSCSNAGDISGTTYNDSATAALGSIFDRQGIQVTNIQGSITTVRAFDDAGTQLSESCIGGPLNALSVTNGLNPLSLRTNLSILRSNVLLSQYSTSFDDASRVKTVVDGTNLASYAYLANSPLIAQILYTNGSTLRMTRSNGWDNLNRLTNLIWKIGATTVASFAYEYNSANQRTKRADSDGSYWLFGYDSLGQLTSAKRYWSDASPVAGQHFEFGFDDIGNRTVTRAGGDQFNGSYLRSASYANNTLNQITSRDVPGYLNAFGAANSNATVSLWTADGYWAQTSRHADWYRGELAINNSTGALWLTITNLAVLPNGTSADIATNWTGNVFVPKTSEAFSYDRDGNLTNDGRFTITWDAENRATSFTSLTNAPSGSKVRVDCAYDSQWRRTQKIVSTWNGSSYVAQSTNRFVYDGWNLIAILDSQSSILYSFTWGTDLSGTPQSAGGIGGLISMRVHTGALAGTYFYVFDGNGNVMMLINAIDGSTAAQYEYSPFGELLRATGPLAFINPFRFSTKFQDDETRLLYYGYRYYDPGTGKWLSRDPLGEEEANNLYSYVNGDVTSQIDLLGLSSLRFVVIWGQLTATSDAYSDPWGAGEGNSSTDGKTYAQTRVKIYSGKGLTCNTIYHPNPYDVASGAIHVYYTPDCAGPHRLYFEVELKLYAGGKIGRASATLSGLDPSRYYFRGYVNPKRSPKIWRAGIIVDFNTGGTQEVRILWWEPIIALAGESTPRASWGEAEAYIKYIAEQ